MSATHLSSPFLPPPGPIDPGDRWSFDAGQQMVVLRGAVARHLTGRQSCRLSLKEFLARIPDAAERERCRLLEEAPPGQPVELSLLAEDGQAATFGFTVAAASRRRRRGQVRLLGRDSLDRQGGAMQSAMERLVVALAPCRMGAVLLLLQVEESGLIGSLEAWDPLIGRIMRRLERVGEVRLACQLGDDVLAVLIEGGHPGRALDLVREIGDGGLGVEGLERLGSLTAGVAVYPLHGRGAAELCRAASIALAAARRSGPNASAVFDDALAAEVMERRSLLAALRGALGRGEFDLLYQPVIDLQQRRLHGVEALLRWRHPTLGAVSPERFVPLLEELGQIRQVTEWLIERSTQDLEALLAAHPSLRLALNLVPAQIEPQQMGGLLTRLAAIGCERVTLEITERAVLEGSPAAAAALAAAKAAGVEVAIDDFGTGYSSLAYLERFAIDVVKIDKRFIARLEQDGRLADAILGMAGALGLKPVAEGVETGAQLAWLASRGCRYVQGYFFAPPLDRQGIWAYARDFAFPAGQLDAALWPRARALPRLLSENQEQALRLFVRHVPAAVAMFDGEMRYLVASDRWLEDYGIGDQEVVGRRHYDVLPDTPERWRQVHARCLAEGTVERCEEDFYLRPDGSREWLRWEVHPFRNRVGDVAGIIIFTEFVTARKDAEQRLAESEQRLREVLASSSDWLWETDDQHRFVLDTDGRRKTDIGADRLIGRTRWEVAGVADPRAHPLWRAHLADLDARRPFHKFEYEALDDQGRRAHFEVSGAPIIDEAGRFRGYRGTACNITDRKEAELRLAESEQRLRDYLAAASDWAWELDAELRLKAYFGDMERHGLHPGTALGRRPWELAGVADADADPLWGPHKRDLEAQRPFRDFVCSQQDAAGGRRWLSVSGHPIYAPDGSFAGYRGATRDITAIRLSEAERQRQHEQLELAGELAGLGYWEVDYRTGQVTWSSRLFQLTGRDPATFVPTLESRFDIYHPDDRPRVQRTIAAAVGEGRPLDIRARIVRPDGAVRHVVSRGRARHDPSGRARSYFGFIQDVTDQVQAQLALEERSRENELYRAMIDALPDYIFAKDLACRFLAANAATARIMRAGSAAELIGRTDEDFYPPELAARFRADEQAFFARGETVILEQPMRRLDGSAGWLCSLKTPFRDAQGRIIAYVGHGRDITEAKAAAEEIRRLKADAEEARDLLRMATSVMTEGFALFDPQDRLVNCNEAFTRFYGEPAEALLGRTFEELQRLASHREGLDLPSGGFEPWLRQRLDRHRSADGSPMEVWYRGQAYLVREHRMPNGWTVLLRAHVTHLKQVEQELRRLATTDALTGAFNRRYFVEHADRLLARCRQAGEPAAVLLLDIDHFKQVNDSRGHAAGDEALRRVCEACQQRLRPDDLFARWGGEEFILLLPRADRESATAIAERLRQEAAGLQLGQPGAGFRVTLSVGVATGQGDLELEELTRRADRALYAAKAQGRDQVVVHGGRTEPVIDPAGS